MGSSLQDQTGITQNFVKLVTPTFPHHVIIKYCTRICTYFVFLTGDPLDINIDQSSRVLPASCGDHSSDVIGCALAWEVPYIRYDTRVYKVRHNHFTVCTYKIVYKYIYSNIYVGSYLEETERFTHIIYFYAQDKSVPTLKYFSVCPTFETSFNGFQ